MFLKHLWAITSAAFVAWNLDFRSVESSPWTTVTPFTTESNNDWSFKNECSRALLTWCLDSETLLWTARINLLGGWCGPMHRRKQIYNTPHFASSALCRSHEVKANWVTLLFFRAASPWSISCAFGQLDWWSDRADVCMLWVSKICPLTHEVEKIESHMDYSPSCTHSPSTTCSL